MIINQIIISGSQGSGKTTLSNAITEKYGISYLGYETRKNMPPGFKTHKDLIRMAGVFPDMGIDFQSNLIEGRLELFKENKSISYVSDRAVIDSFIYYTLHNSIFDSEEHSKYLFNKVLESFSVSKTFVILSVHSPNIVSDNVRITNKYYSDVFDTLICNYSYDWLLKAYKNKIDESLEFYNDNCSYFKLTDKTTNQVKMLILNEKKIGSIKSRLDILNKELNLESTCSQLKLDL